MCSPCLLLRKATAIAFLFILACTDVFAQSSNCFTCQSATNSSAPGSFALAGGYQSFASGDFSTAIGLTDTASGNGSIALGTGNKALNAYSFASGQNNICAGAAAVALGSNNSAGGNSSIAFGTYSNAAGNYSMAFGAFASASANNSFAYGTNVQVTAANAVVIGTGLSGSQPLLNSISNSFMVGFNGTRPTLFVSPPASSGQIGQVGIGTTTIPQGQILAVGGGIISEAMNIKLQSDWPDFVFEKDYPLMPLPELKKFVQENKHLPGVPAENQMKEQGLDVEKMNALLLQKVEELSIYVISLQEQVDQLKKLVTETPVSEAETTGAASGSCEGE